MTNDQVGMIWGGLLTAAGVVSLACDAFFVGTIACGIGVLVSMYCYVDVGASKPSPSSKNTDTLDAGTRSSIA